MFTYFAYNHKIYSDLELHGFLPVNFQKLESFDYPSITISMDKKKPVKFSDNRNDFNFLSGTVPGSLSCSIKNGKTIIVNPEQQADMDFIRTVVAGELMAALLRQKGYLVLHGSCVTNDKYTIGFVGYSGWGKSTTAAYFVKNGYKLLGEDLLVLDLNDSEPRVIPGPYALKLKPHVVEALGLELSDGIKAHETTDKYIYKIPISQSDTRQPHTLHNIYFLEGVSRDSNNLVPMSNSESMVELVKHTHNMRWLVSKEYMVTHFYQCSMLLKKIRVSLLQRKRSLNLLPELRRLIETDLIKSC